MAALRRFAACQPWQMLRIDGAPVAATLSHTSRALSESGTELLSCGNRGMSSSSREGSDKAATDAQREDILETGKRANQDRVKESPAPSKQKWWKPDPVTGVWVPEDTHGPIDTAQEASIMKQILM